MSKRLLISVLLGSQLFLGTNALAVVSGGITFWSSVASATGMGFGSGASYEAHKARDGVLSAHLERSTSMERNLMAGTAGNGISAVASLGAFISGIAAWGLESKSASYSAAGFSLLAATAGLMSLATTFGAFETGDYDRYTADDLTKAFAFSWVNMAATGLSAWGYMSMALGFKDAVAGSHSIHMTGVAAAK